MNIVQINAVLANPPAKPVALSVIKRRKTEPETVMVNREVTPPPAVVLPPPPGTLAERVASGFANAEVKYDKDAVSKLIRRELRERKSIPFLSDLGRETVDKAERLFEYLNGQFSV